MMYELLMMLMGWLYPAFATYGGLNGGLRTQIGWMKYWIVFGVFNALHLVTGCVEPWLPWLPLLAGFKLIGLWWLLPGLGGGGGGSQLIYDDLLEPLLRRNQAAIGVLIDGVCGLGGAALRELIKLTYRLLVDVVDQCWLQTRSADDIHVTPRLQAAIDEVIAELRAARQAACLPAPPEPKPERVPAPAANTKSISITKSKPEPVSASEEQLRILVAEAASARRMQLGQRLSSQEHLAPIWAGQPHSNLDPDLELEADRAYSEYCAAKRQRERQQMEQLLEH